MPDQVPQEIREERNHRLLELVNEVLDVSRIESGRLELALVPLALGPVVAESLPLLAAKAEAMGVALIDQTAGIGACEVVGDRLRLKEVLINLLSNAVKYNVPGGRVTIRARSEGPHVLLEVEDTGSGLSAAQLANLFQPFNRLGAEASGIEGSGMGLFVSRRFIDLMGGAIDVESSPGVGTTVKVRLNAAL